MLTIKNTEVFGLERAIKASGNPMSIGEINTQVNKSDYDYYGYGIEDKEFKRAYKLGSVSCGSGHDNFLSGIIVTADFHFPNYWLKEFYRYHFVQTISSQSTMHRLTTMGKDENFSSMFNKYTARACVDIVKEIIDLYNSYNVDDFESKEDYDEERYNTFMMIVSSLPMGFEMEMTITTNYLQLKTIYFQRRGHKLREDWGSFCDWCESLPMFKELIGIN